MTSTTITARRIRSSFACRVAGRGKFCRAASKPVLWNLLALSLLAGTCQAQELVLAVSRTALSLPIIVADDQGYFVAEGVSVRTQECIGGQRCLRLLLDGQVQLATATDLPVMFNSFDRADYAIIATFVSSVRDLKLVVRKSAGIASAKELAGKRIATVKGASAHYFLDSYLLLNDVNKQNITVVPLQPEQMAGALERKEVDAISVWEPFAYLTMKAVGADALILPSTRIYTETFNLVADRATIASREADLVKVLRAIERGQRFIREQTKQAQAIMLARLKLDQGFVDWAWNDLNYRMSLDQSLVTTLEGEARWALREGHVQGNKPIPDYLKFVHPSALRIAVPGAVTILK